MSDNDTAFERQARMVLQESIARLDGRVRSRLTQARFRALEELSARERTPLRLWFGGRSLVPAGALAVVAVLGVMLWVARPDAVPGLQNGAVEDIELLADAEVIDLAAEDDPEFYEWAVAQAEDELRRDEALGS
jgi:hypothetical protein